MKVNRNTVLVGQNVVLVPYDKRHVPRYHQWMQDIDLRELTASEPLSLEEEYDMQRKWQEDDDKLTFIILACNRPDSGLTDMDTKSPDIVATNPSPNDPHILALPMIGDVNLFLKGVPPIMHGLDTESCDDLEFEAEVEVMIAEKSYRRKGLAREALRLILSYATGYPSSLFDRGSASGSSTKPSTLAQEPDQRCAVDACTPPLDDDQTNTRDSPCSSLSRSPEDEKADTGLIAPHLASVQRNRLLPQLQPPLPIPPSSLRARINQNNHASLQLFSQLGFVTVRLVEVFGEVEMRWIGSEM